MTPAPRYTRLLLATTNAGKIREIRVVLAGLPVELLTLADWPDIPAPDETGATFAENAALKAFAYAEAFGVPTVAEDSGLVIDALGGRPGVHSARYPGRTYEERFLNLHKELTPFERPWTARFVCALAFVDPVDAPGVVRYRTEARVEGEITDVAGGENGFGYDPIFFYPPYDCTLAEVDSDRKLAVAHRGQAFRQFREWLTTSGGDAAQRLQPLTDSAG